MYAGSGKPEKQGLEGLGEARIGLFFYNANRPTLLK